MLANPVIPNKSSNTLSILVGEPFLRQKRTSGEKGHPSLEARPSRCFTGSTPAPASTLGCSCSRQAARKAGQAKAEEELLASCVQASKHRSDRSGGGGEKTMGVATTRKVLVLAKTARGLFGVVSSFSFFGRGHLGTFSATRTCGRCP